MNDQISIRIPSDAPIAKVVSIIRSIEPLPISEITSRIKNSEDLLSYRYTSTNGTKNILHCYSELTKIGISPSLFEHGRPTSIEFLNNLNKTYQEISDEIDAEIDSEDDIDE